MKKIFFLLNVLLIASFVEAQTGIGTTTPHASAKLDVFSTTKGFLPPRMTATERDGIPSPAAGLMVYQTDGTSGLYYYNGAAWIYIINSTTNVVSVVNGGTGTTTATGTGSVVLNTSPSLITPALGTPSSATLTNASGLPIASGVSGLGTGIASFLATPTSSNLASAISDETGSGALVFGTSPTLTTPALGTPSSATLTNASGLPIASGVSGLGTGVASFLATPTSSNLASAISDETGSGALVFGTSPSLITPTLGVASGTSLALTGNTVSNSTSTGALTVAGGVGIGGALNASSVTATNFIGGETPIYLSANKSSSQSIPYNVTTTVTNWDGAPWINNYPSAWNSTTGEWTCPRAGIYEFFFTATLDLHSGSGIGNEFAVTLFLNGFLQSVGDFWAQTSSNTRAPHAITNLIMSLNVNDVVTTRIYQNLNLNAINTTGGRLYFQIKQLPSRINIQ
jgi:hypothetical protein